jgi:hypothetical protein
MFKLGVFGVWTVLSNQIFTTIIMDRAFVHLLSLCFTYEHTFLVLNLQGRKGNHNQAEGAESEARGHGQHDAKRYLVLFLSYV